MQLVLPKDTATKVPKQVSSYCINIKLKDIINPKKKSGRGLAAGGGHNYYAAASVLTTQV
jgi:hypothetical protein